MTEDVGFDAAGSAGQGDASAGGRAPFPIPDEGFYRELVESMNDGVVTHDAAGTITSASPRLCELLACTAGDIVGTRGDRWVEPGWGPSWAARFAPSASLTPQTFEIELVRKDGQPIVALVSRRPVFDALGKFRGSIALVTDLTEQRREASRLQELAEASAALTGEEFFRSAARTLATAFDPQAVFVAECADYPTTRVRILAEWDRGRHAEPREFSLAGTPCEATIRDGRVTCLSDNLLERFPTYRERERTSYLGVPLFDAGGQGLIGHLAFWGRKPIADAATLAHPVFRIFASRVAAELRRKHAEEQARQHLQQLAHVARLASMREMATAIAHEVNQPLTAILSYSQACMRLLRSANAPVAEIADAMARVAEGAERASRIIRHLRSLVRKDDAQRLPVQVNDLVGEVARLVRPEARQSDVEIRTELAEGLPLVLAEQHPDPAGAGEPNPKRDRGDQQRGGGRTPRGARRHPTRPGQHGRDVRRGWRTRIR